MAYPPWRRVSENSHSVLDSETCIDGQTHDMEVEFDGREQCVKCGFETEPPHYGSFDAPQGPVSKENSNGPEKTSVGPKTGKDWRGTSLSLEARILEKKARVWSRNLNPDKKSDAQKEVESLMRSLSVWNSSVDNHADGSRIRIDILRQALKAKRKRLKSTNNEPIFLPSGRSHNAIVTTFCVELFHQEGGRENSVGVDNMMQQMRNFLSSRAEESILEKHEEQIRSYLSRDIRVLRKLLGSTRRRQNPSQTIWIQFLDSCHKMMRNSDLTPVEEWTDFMDWCRAQDGDMMTSLLPPGNKTKGFVSFEIVRIFAGKPSRKILMEALSIDGKSYRSSGYASKAKEIVGKWENKRD